MSARVTATSRHGHDAGPVPPVTLTPAFCCSVPLRGKIDQEGGDDVMSISLLVPVTVFWGVSTVDVATSRAELISRLTPPPQQLSLEGGPFRASPGLADDCGAGGSAARGLPRGS